MQNRRSPSKEEMEAHTRAIAERFHLLPKIPAPTRDNTAVCIPTADGKIELGTVRGLIASMPMWSGWVDMPMCSHVQLARNRLIHQFRQTPFEWCVMIDTDIIFTREDFAFLMGAAHGVDSNKTDYAVTAPYARKDDSGETIDKGLGFTRVHRSVFDVLEKTLCTWSDFRGEELTDFFVSGSIGTGIWMGEDTGFWLLCENIGVKPRVETRTQLRHVGRAEYAISSLMNL